MLKGQTILITGATGQVAFPVARHLAVHNRVLALARYGKEGSRARVQQAGAEPITGDIAAGALDEIPRGIDVALHFAMAAPGEDFDAAIATNAEGAGLLMARCAAAGARAFLHCSTTGVYRGATGARCTEASPLADHHRHLMPVYSISKIAAEAVVRLQARALKLPTVIARLAVPYGSAGGWPWYHLLMMKNGAPIPVHPQAPNVFPLLHEDDYISHIPALLEFANVPARVVNWAGSEDTCIEDWCAEIGRLTGFAPRLETTPKALAPLLVDTSLLQSKAGPTRVKWQDGIRRMVESKRADWAG